MQGLGVRDSVMQERQLVPGDVERGEVLAPDSVFRV